jgi:hypothetical protein
MPIKIGAHTPMLAQAIKQFQQLAPHTTGDPLVALYRLLAQSAPSRDTKASAQGDHELAPGDQARNGPHGGSGKACAPSGLDAGPIRTRHGAHFRTKFGPHDGPFVVRAHSRDEATSVATDDPLYQAEKTPSTSSSGACTKSRESAPSISPPCGRRSRARSEKRSVRRQQANFSHESGCVPIIRFAADLARLQIKDSGAPHRLPEEFRVPGLGFR